MFSGNISSISTEPDGATMGDTRDTFDFEDGDGPVKAHRHSNGGGWVANTSTVDPTVFVGPNALVFGRAKVEDVARIEDLARIHGLAKIGGSARVGDSAEIFGDALVSHDATVIGRAKIGGNAVLLNRACARDEATVSGDAALFDDAVVCGNSVISGDIRIKGKDVVDGRTMGSDSRSLEKALGLEPTLLRQTSDVVYIEQFPDVTPEERRVAELIQKRFDAHRCSAQGVMER
jgi:carbonic anhydrase/acetyltransferase-like protein (isoleucine patch superfamily)